MTGSYWRKNKLKKYFILIFIILILSIDVYSTDKIVGWDNREKTGNDIRFDGKNFLLADQTIPLDDAAYLEFNIENREYKNDNSIMDNPSPEELLKRAEVLQKQFPDSSLLILNDEGIQKLNMDGSRYTRSRYSVKIMNEKEISNYNILSLYDEKGNYESRIIMARSISPDGSISYLKPSDISITKPHQGLDFFNQHKEERIIKAVIPDVKVGSIVDFDYETNELSPEDKNQYYTSWYFSGDKPVYKSKLNVIIPANKQYYYVMKNCNIKPVITEAGRYKIYSFEKGISSPIISEPNSPPAGELYPSFFGSVFKDQTYLSKWLSKFLKERLVSNDEMKKTVEALIARSKAVTEEDKISILYKFVQEYINYRSIKTSLSSGFSGHPAIETFNNRYGDCIDKSILFATLLGITGIEAYPVILSTNDNPVPLYNKIGVMTGNHAIDEIHLKENGNKIIYLDTTSTTYRYPSFREDDQGTLAWNPMLNTVNYIEPVDASYNTQKYTKEINLSRDGSGNIKSHVIYSGDVEAGIREYFLTLSADEIKSTLRAIVTNDYPGAVLVSYNYSDPADTTKNLSLNIHYKSDNIAKKNNQYLIFNIPIAYNFDYISLKERKYPLVFSTTMGKNNNITVLIPPGCKLVGIPANIKIENKFFSYEAEYKIDKSKIVFQDKYRRSSCRIEPADYKQFREDALKIDCFIRKPLIFIEK